MESSIMKPDSGHRTEVPVFYFLFPSDVVFNPHLKQGV